MKDGSGKIFKIWFVFQKTRYSWDFEEKGFRGISFPIDQSYVEYLNWKGYQSDLEIKDAEGNYGKNEFVLVFILLLGRLKKCFYSI